MKLGPLKQIWNDWLENPDLPGFLMGVSALCLYIVGFFLGISPNALNINLCFLFLGFMIFYALCWHTRRKDRQDSTVLELVKQKELPLESATIKVESMLKKSD